MEVILYSKCIKHLQTETAKTSSEIFELEFIKALSYYANKILIISEQAISFQKEDNGKILLYPIKRIGRLNINLKKIIKESGVFLQRNDKNRTIIMFGYDYLNLIELKRISKNLSANLISFTFDTHKPALTNRSIFKKILMNMYFISGMRKLRSISGVILFKEEAYGELSINIPYLISKVGIQESAISNYVYQRKRKDSFKIVYAGSLEKYNGIEEMIEAMKLIDSNLDVSLDIYGSGSLINYITDISHHDFRINYKGLLPKVEIEKAIKDADLLLNLRDPNDYVSKFAFPSKLIQYMANGVPVLSTKVIDDIQFEEAAFIVDEFTPQKISEKIEYVVHNPVEQYEKAAFAKKYITNNYLWNDIITDVYNFLRKI